MTVLVFGKSGQVGRELARRGTVVSLGRDDANLADPAACAAKIHEMRPDLVINAAAYTAVDAAESDEAAAFVVNADAPGAMAVACARIGVPFLHISTDYVFDGSGDQAWRVGDETGPVSAYGRSKLAGEAAVVAAGGPHAILRTSWVFSADGANFVKTMLRLAASRDNLNVVADQVGGPTAAADIADALLVMAEAFLAGRGASGIYHFAGAPDVSWADFAREIFAQSGQAVAVSDIPSEQYPMPAARPANSRLDCRDLARDFAISRPEWRSSLADVLAELADIKVQNLDG